MLTIAFKLLSTIPLISGLHTVHDASNSLLVSDEPRTLTNSRLDVDTDIVESNTVVYVDRHVSHIEDISLPDQSNEHIQTDITLCIPLEMSRFNKDLFDNKFLPSLQQLSALPREVIIAGSGMDASRASEIKRLVSSFSSAPVYVTSKEEGALAGENRNRCARESRGRVISFFDADDAMHPRRLELLSTLFAARAPIAVIHGWMSAQHEMKGELGNSFTVYNGFDIFQPKTKPTEEQQMSMTAPAQQTYTLSKGWITVYADVFAHVQQNETLHVGEDHQFIRDILRFYGPGDSTLMYIAEPLGWFSHGSWGGRRIPTTSLSPDT